MTYYTHFAGAEPPANDGEPAERSAAVEETPEEAAPAVEATPPSEATKVITAHDMYTALVPNIPEM